MPCGCNRFVTPPSHLLLQYPEGAATVGRTVSVVIGWQSHAHVSSIPVSYGQGSLVPGLRLRTYIHSSAVPSKTPRRR